MILTLKKRAVNIIGWFVAWDDSLPLRDLFIWDLDTKHCTFWLWRHRLAGWFVCLRKGHTWYPDHCGQRDHDICKRCNDRRGSSCA